MKEAHLIYNPVSAKGKCLEVAKQIKTWASNQQDLNLVAHETENVGHATAITRDLTSTGKPVTILVLGGDGSVNDVLNGINDFENTTIGILPFGSGNDFFRALDVTNQDPIYLVNEYLNNQNTRMVDYLIINDKYRCINEVGFGMSAEVIALRNKMKRFSPATQYKIATIVRSFFWKSFDYKVTFDNQTPQDIKTMWFTINNGICIGGGLKTAPDAKIDDGLITISYIKKFNRIKTLPILIKCKKGKVATLKNNVTLTCKEVKLEGHNMTLEYDGNLLQGLDSVHVKLIPSKLKLLTIRK